ncbi:MAG: N-6 DNA methylase [Planctomycetaceae bacterium]
MSTLPASASQKQLGSYYTPSAVARTLVKWAVRNSADRLLDPACGDGRFLAEHQRSVGVDCDVEAVIAARRRVSHGRIHVGDFFEWAEQTPERFDCAAGNPPFIRYQRFAGNGRERAIKLCRRLGATFSGLSSSWAPFLVATAGLLNRGGRLAFLIPAEVGHAPYARPLIDYLAENFSRVQLIAVRDKLFPELSEDVWILYAEGFGGNCRELFLTPQLTFVPTATPPARAIRIGLDELARCNYRIRRFLLPASARHLYDSIRTSDRAIELGRVARVGIGYVSGANDFFHLRPTTARMLDIPRRYLAPSVRSARYLSRSVLRPVDLQAWLRNDEPVLLLRLPKKGSLPAAVIEYLESPAGIGAREGYKCRMRTPWYVVPDVRTPDAFLSYMSGEVPQLVVNAAQCVCTNSVHALTLTNGHGAEELARRWRHPVVSLSCEIEGHPLGGGMLKIEPGEAARILLPRSSLQLDARDVEFLQEGIQTMRQWRHYA